MIEIVFDMICLWISFNEFHPVRFFMETGIKNLREKSFRSNSLTRANYTKSVTVVPSLVGRTDPVSDGPCIGTSKFEQHLQYQKQQRSCDHLDGNDFQEQ
ncbi:hypothetical protein TNCT_486981 [Trichonephila clavata]|uniref:Uncharacterized protein n=1 Tax=Trichonephila clavata TaxID=2740835 RepID=A0A8X6GW04_TRICU|nr:hypothetical protein TNCT_486981 [Trichonephila clavata]